MAIIKNFPAFFGRKREKDTVKEPKPLTEKPLAQKASVEELKEAITSASTAKALVTTAPAPASTAVAKRQSIVPKGDSIVQFLQSHVLFKGLDESFVEMLASSMQVRVFNDMDFVIKKGQVGRAMFFVRRGSVEVVSEDGETILNVMQQGSFFGEIGLLFSVPRTASCRCNGRCIILVLTKDKFSKAMLACPQAGRAITLIAQERFSSYVKQQESEVNIDFGEELKLGITNDDLKNVPLFRDCQVGFLHMMAMSLKPIQYNRGEFIIKQGEMASEMYFVARGTAEIINEETNQIYGQFNTGTFFGEIGLLFKVARTASVRCSSNLINVFKLTKVDLDTILEQFPEVAEKINIEAKLRLEKDKQNKILAMTKTEEANADVEVTRERLKSVPMFQDASVGLLHQLALSLKLAKYKKTDLIIKKNDKGSSMFIILEGVAAVVSDDGLTIYAELSNNSFFGEVALFYDIARTATVRAETDLTLFELTKDAFQMVLSSHPVFAKSSLEMAAFNYNLFQTRQAALAMIKAELTGDAQSYDVDATAKRLKSVPLFKNCDLNFLKSLALNTSIHTYVKLDLIIKKGEAASSMFIIVHGDVEIVSEDGLVIYDTMKGGGFFGEIGLMRGVPRTASIRVSSEKCDVIQLTAKSLNNVAKHNLDCYQQITLEAARRFDLVQKRSNKKEDVPGFFTKMNKKMTDLGTKIKRNAAQEMNNTVSSATSKLGAMKKSLDMLSTSKDSIDGEIAGAAAPNGESKADKKKSLKNKTEDDEKLTKLLKKSQNDLAKSSSKLFSAKSKNILSASTVSLAVSRLQSESLQLSHAAPRIISSLGKLSVLSLDPYSLYVVSQFLNVSDRMRLRFVCKLWSEELIQKSHWEMMNFLSMSSVMNQIILKYFCELMGDNMYSLQLKNCYRITDTELKGISLTCRNVGELVLSNCWTITDRGIGYIAKNLKSLVALDISYCSQIQGSGFDDHQWTGLRHLDISYCKQIGDDELELVLSKTPELRSISMRRCKKISDFGIFTVVRFCRLISTLNLSDCDQITEKTVKWIASGCAKLSSLNLTFCTKINSAGIFEIQMSSPTLTKLVLDYCVQLTEPAIVSLLSNAASMKEVSLRGCKRLKDPTILSIVRACKKLELLDLTSCPELTLELSQKVKKIDSKIVVRFDTHRGKKIGKRAAGAKVAGELTLRQRYTNVPREAPAMKKKKKMVMAD